METAVTFDNAFGHVRVNPTINDRVLEMRLRHAEDRADRNAKMLLESETELARVRGELVRLTGANQNLLLRIHTLTVGNPCLALPGVNA